MAVSSTRDKSVMITIGIDPGATGAFAVCRDGKILDAVDLPVMARSTGKGNELNARELGNLLVPYINGSRCIIESVHAMPGQGVSSTFHFGESFGALKAVLSVLEIPYTLVTPQRWKKHYGLIGHEKDAARTLAITRFPEVADKLKRKKDCGRADAILMAAFPLAW